MTGDEGGVLATTVVMVLKGGDDKLANFDSIQFVGAPTAGDETLLNLATSVAKTTKIELGAVTKQGDDLVGANAVGTAQFDLPEERLAEMARLDDAMRVVKNQFANGGDPKRSITGVQEFYFDAPLLDGLGKISDPATVTFNGWSPALHIDHEDFDFAALCAGTVAFRFDLPTPGAKRNVGDATFLTALTNTSPQMNPDGNSCGVSNGADTAYIKHDAGQKPIYMNFQPFKSRIPPGAWSVKLDGELKAKFDLDVSYPLVTDPKDAAKLVPRVYVPAIEIVTDAMTHDVVRVDLWFYAYDKKSGTYRKVENYATVKQTLDGYWFGLDGHKGADSVSDPMSSADSYGLPEDGMPKSRSSFSQKWRLTATDDAGCPAPTDHARVESIGVQYIMYGNRYSTTFNLPRVKTNPGDCN